MNKRIGNISVLLGADGAVHLHEELMPSRSGAGSVLVRMLYSPVNPADLLTVDGTYPFPLGAMPILGAEGVGIVEATGPGVATVSPGDLVLPLSRGNWCRYRLLDAQDVVQVPPGIEPCQAAMLRINPMTALFLLKGAVVGEGSYLIQNAAASAVGHWVRVFAHASGVSVINVVRPASDAVLPNRIEDGPDLAERIRGRVAADQVQGALDCVGGDATGRLAASVSAGARIIVFGHLSGAPAVIPTTLLTGKGLTVKGFSLRPAEASATAKIRQQAFARIFAAASDPVNRLLVRDVVPVDQVRHALELARRAGPGRVVLSMGD